MFFYWAQDGLVNGYGIPKDPVSVILEFAFGNKKERKIRKGGKIQHLLRDDFCD